MTQQKTGKLLETQHDHLMWLLASLVFILFVVPLVENSVVGRGLLRIGFTFVLLSAPIATRRRRVWLWCGLFLAGIAIPTHWVTMFVDVPWLFVSVDILDCMFLVAMAVLILKAVLQKHLATVQSIYGAIAAYLLLGLAWAMLYAGIDRMSESTLSIASSSGGDLSTSEVSVFSHFIYFSFVTMSTLGYGDITPGTPLARTLTWMQSVTGQFFIAVLVAWLVSEIPHGRKRPGPPGEPDTG